MKPRLVDLGCRRGGATAGYMAAGFHVTGVDVEPQPGYPGDEFIQADMLTVDLEPYDVIHASPPCQAYTAMRHMWNARKDHPDILEPVRDRLITSGKPWVIENVPGSPMLPMIMLCGTSFGLGTGEFQLRRHRWFQTSGWWALSPPCQHTGPTIGIYGDHGRGRDLRRRGNLGRYFTMAECCEAMGIDWMRRDDLNQAIPPVYTEWIGQQLQSVMEEIRTCP
jgi:DNA (cytosine-5)-methyltransferase 1